MSHNTSTAALNSRLFKLKQQSASISEHLTSSLSASPSGQILLQLAKTLDSNHAVPDAHDVVVKECLKPMLKDVESLNANYAREWARVYELAKDLRIQARRAESAREALEKMAELEEAEQILRDQGEDEDCLFMELERVAYSVLDLSQELKVSTDEVMRATTFGLSADVQRRNGMVADLKKADENSNKCLEGEFLQSLPVDLFEEAMPPDGERAQFFMKLASRIRKLENDLANTLIQKLEALFKSLEVQANGDSQQRHEVDEDDKEKFDHDGNLISSIDYCVRALAIIGKGKDVESVFARVAIMPLLRSKLSLGRMDEGGSRGQCAGLFSMLDEISYEITRIYGPIIQKVSEEFSLSGENDDFAGCPEIDLVTGGVWIPLTAAITGDTSIKMAIFSPGSPEVIQANYTAVDTFVIDLAARLLKPALKNGILSTNDVIKSRERILTNPTTIDFYKKWNLAIYYQLRFGDACKRFDDAVEKVKGEGWDAIVFSGDDVSRKCIDELGFEIHLFSEVYATLMSFWAPGVFLRPLAHRFLRGSVQIINALLDFIQYDPKKNGHVENGEGSAENGHKLSSSFSSWKDRIEDIAMISWNLTVLKVSLDNNFIDVISNAVAPDDDENCHVFNSSQELNETKSLLTDIIVDTSREITPLVESYWETIIDRLKSQCCRPLSAVKGVAATYRMTNRPPPTHPSPYVSTILRPLQEFDNEFENRVPIEFRSSYKSNIVGHVSESYCKAVEELIVTVKQTEQALRKRKARRTVAGGMSDGEKVMQQIRLDLDDFRNSVTSLSLEPESFEGIEKIQSLLIS